MKHLLYNFGLISAAPGIIFDKNEQGNDNLPFNVREPKIEFTTNEKDSPKIYSLRICGSDQG